MLESLGIRVNPFLPMNCGFECPWSEYFKKNVDRCPLKNILITFKGHSLRSEVMLTPFGIEGNGIYAISNFLREELIKNQFATLSLDLAVDIPLDLLIQKLKERNKKVSLSNHLRKALGFKKVILILLKELLSAAEFENVVVLAEKIKNLEIKLFKTRPLEEAISTSGGVTFSGLTANLELIAFPGLYIAGEMLDFEAPTGGYLLQGCFSSAWAVVTGIVDK